MRLSLDGVKDLVRFELRIKTQIVVHVDTLLEVRALIQVQIVLLILLACCPVRERRDPCSLWLENLRFHIVCILEPGTTSLDS